MNSQKAERINFISSAIFMLLFFLAVAAFTEKPVEESRHLVQREFTINLHFNGLVAQSAHLPSFEICCSSFLKHIGIKTFDATRKLLNDNQSIARQEIHIEKIELQIKPVTLLRFYVPLHYLQSEEPPVLS